MTHVDCWSEVCNSVIVLLLSCPVFLHLINGQLFIKVTHLIHQHKLRFPGCGFKVFFDDVIQLRGEEVDLFRNLVCTIFQLIFLLKKEMRIGGSGIEDLVREQSVIDVL